MSDEPPDTPVPPPGFAGGQPNVPTVADASPSTVPVPPRRTSPPPKRSSPLRWIVPLVLLLVVAGAAIWFVAGSGDDDTASTDPAAAKAEARAAFEAWTGDLLAGDTDAACKGLTKDTAGEVADEGSSCPDGLARLATDLGIPTDGEAKVTVLGVSVDKDGRRAEITYQVAGADPAAAPLVLVVEDDVWRVDLLARGLGSSTVDAGEEVGCATQLKTVQTAVDAYFALNGEYPPDMKALTESFLNEAPKGIELGPDGTVIATGDCS